MKDFYVIGLKRNRRKFPLVPCRAFCSFPFLLRPCNIGINSLLIEMVMSCWHFITVDVVTVIFNSSSEGGIASPLNTLVFSAAKAGSRCWVNNSCMWVQKNALWHLFQIFSHVFLKRFLWSIPNHTEEFSLDWNFWKHNSDKWKGFFWHRELCYEEMPFQSQDIRIEPGSHVLPEVCNCCEIFGKPPHSLGLMPLKMWYNDFHYF